MDIEVGNWTSLIWCAVAGMVVGAIVDFPLSIIPCFLLGVVWERTWPIWRRKG